MQATLPKDLHFSLRQEQRATVTTEITQKEPQ